MPMSDNKVSRLTDSARQATGNSVVIPKEQMTAFERWELTSFNAESSKKQPSKAQNTNLPGIEPAYLLQQEQEQIYSLKREEGYTAGMHQAQSDAKQIHALLQNLHTSLNQIDEQVAQSLLDLALEIAHQMVRETLSVNPEIILKVVSEAIGRLPHFNQNPHLVLHPDDAELVRTQMGDQLSHANWKIITNPKIQRGGCRVETAHSNIDATNEARWQHIVASIGQDQSWLKI